MSTITPNLSLVEPAYGSAGWWSTNNSNFATLDTVISPWFYGAGAPGTIAGQTNNSFYLDTVGQALYKRIANVWNLVWTVTATGGGGGGGGSLPSGIPNLVLATDPSGSSSATAYLRSLVIADIPALPQSLITGLTAALALLAPSSALAALAPIASPTFTGTPAAPTPASSDNSTRLATTYFVNEVVAAAISGGSGYSPIWAQVPTGTINGTNTSFALTVVPVYLAVFQNGYRLTPTTDYSFSGTTLALVTAPSTGDVLLVDILH
jgi:hypothetical protein